jgi:hypothetical protein
LCGFLLLQLLLKIPRRTLKLEPVDPAEAQVLISGYGLQHIPFKKMNGRSGPWGCRYSSGDHALHSATLSGEANGEPGL